FYDATATTPHYTLALHDALPIYFEQWKTTAKERVRRAWMQPPPDAPWDVVITGEEDRGSYVVRKLVFNISGDSRVEAYLSVPKGDRKSTRLNSSHVKISYAVFCL